VARPEARGEGHALHRLFDGKRLFDAEDDTFKEAGKVTPWIKADSATYFDDLQIEGHNIK
jgi:hypothetical protein